MTAQRSGTSKGRVCTPAHPLALPEESDLSDFTPLPVVAMRTTISDKTLKKWSADGTNGCPPLYQVSAKKQLMRTEEVEEWIRSKRYLGTGESDAQAS